MFNSYVSLPEGILNQVPNTPRLRRRIRLRQRSTGSGRASWTEAVEARTGVNVACWKIPDWLCPNHGKICFNEIYRWFMIAKLAYKSYNYGIFGRFFHYGLTMVYQPTNWGGPIGAPPCYTSDVPRCSTFPAGGPNASSGVPRSFSKCFALGLSIDQWHPSRRNDTIVYYGCILHFPNRSRFRCVIFSGLVVYQYRQSKRVWRPISNR